MRADVVRWVRSTAAARLVLVALAASGAAWWAFVAASPDVRRWTLGDWPAGWLAVPDLCFFVAAPALAARRSSWRWACVAAVWTVVVTAALVTYSLATGAAGWGCVGMVPASVLVVAAAVTLKAGHLPTGWFFTGPFRFIVAEPTSRSRHVAASLGQLIVFWTAFFVLVPWLMVTAEERMAIEVAALDHSTVRAIGTIVLLLGSALGLWSCVTMAVVGEGTPLPAATARRLVVRGPYRHVRNPMAVAGAAQTTGVGLIAGSWTVVVAASLGAIVWDLFIRPEEEADLGRRFGQSYETYRAAVRCWVPNLRRA